MGDGRWGEREARDARLTALDKREERREEFFAVFIIIERDPSARVFLH